MSISIYHVDAFTDRPFAGNPAAVCLLPEPRPDEWMQAVAAEMNLSETAFLLRQEDGFDLRWLTPAVEVDLCGHATLASAHVLWEQGILGSAAPARFWTRSGLLTAQRHREWIEMDFPAEPSEAAEPPDGLLEALGARAVNVGRNRFDYLVELATESEVRTLSPDFRQLAAIRTRGTIVTARSDSVGFDFVSRFYCPTVGMNEDPVTGSAHCCLGPYWAARLGKEAMVGRQVSARGGIVRVRPAGNRVILGGQAVTVLEGTLRG